MMMNPSSFMMQCAVIAFCRTSSAWHHQNAVWWKKIWFEPEQMSRQRWDQVVIQNENPELVEKPQRTAVNSFDHIVVRLQKRTEDTLWWRCHCWNWKQTELIASAISTQKKKKKQKTLFPHFTQATCWLSIVSGYFILGLICQYYSQSWTINMDYLLSPTWRYSRASKPAKVSFLKTSSLFSWRYSRRSFAKPWNAPTRMSWRALLPRFIDTTLPRCWKPLL